MSALRTMQADPKRPDRFVAFVREASTPSRNAPRVRRWERRHDQVRLSLWVARSVAHRLRDHCRTMSIAQSRFMADLITQAVMTEPIRPEEAGSVEQLL